MSTKFHGAACKTCRRRGRKCTRELPKCKSCLDKGIECEGYTLKWTGLASRGKLAGKTSMPKAKPTKATKTKVSVPATIERSLTIRQATPTIIHEGTLGGSSKPGIVDKPPTLRTWDPTVFDHASATTFKGESFQARTLVEDSDSSPETDALRRKRINSPFRPSALLEPYSVPIELKFILNYHLKEVTPRLLVDVSTFRNPYSEYILPIAVQRPALLYACAALAACHYNVRLQDQRFHIDCLRFRGKAMRRLQEQLWTEENAKDESNIAAVLMLTLTDMSMGGFSNFDAHFAAARKLIDLRGKTKTPSSFVEQYIAWLDIMLSASNKRKPMFTSHEVALLRGSSTEWSYDVFPCPPDQFEILAHAIELYKMQDTSKMISPEVLSTVLYLKDNLLSLPMHLERGEPWTHLTEAYRHSIALYIIRLFNIPADPNEISWLTSSVFDHAKRTPESTGWSDQLLWPLFHAGLELRDAERQSWLRDRAVAMLRSGGFRNVETIMEILESVWSRNERPDYMSLLSVEGFGNMVAV